MRISCGRSYRRPPQTFVPQRPNGTLRPSGARAPLGPSVSGPPMGLRSLPGYASSGVRSRSPAASDASTSSGAATKPSTANHLRPWDRVPRRRRTRGPDDRAGLFRHAPTCLGARHQREHRRPGLAVRPQADQSGRAHPARLHPHRPPAQPPPAQAARLSHPGGLLCPMNTDGTPATAANVALQS
jgi:hypothetical protein